MNGLFYQVGLAKKEKQNFPIPLWIFVQLQVSGSVSLRGNPEISKFEICDQQSFRRMQKMLFERRRKVQPRNIIIS